MIEKITKTLETLDGLYEKMDDSSEQAKVSALQSQLYFVAGQIYFDRCDYEKALEYFKEALKYLDSAEKKPLNEEKILTFPVLRKNILFFCFMASSHLGFSKKIKYIERIPHIKQTLENEVSSREEILNWSNKCTEAREAISVLVEASDKYKQDREKKFVENNAERISNAVSQEIGRLIELGKRVSQGTFVMPHIVFPGEINSGHMEKCCLKLDFNVYLILANYYFRQSLEELEEVEEEIGKSCDFEKAKKLLKQADTSCTGAESTYKKLQKGCSRTIDFGRDSIEKCEKYLCELRQAINWCKEAKNIDLITQALKVHNNLANIFSAKKSNKRNDEDYESIGKLARESIENFNKLPKELCDFFPRYRADSHLSLALALLALNANNMDKAKAEEAEDYLRKAEEILENHKSCIDKEMKLNLIHIYSRIYNFYAYIDKDKEKRLLYLEKICEFIGFSDEPGKVLLEQVCNWWRNDENDANKICDFWEKKPASCDVLAKNLHQHAVHLFKEKRYNRAIFYLEVECTLRNDYLKAIGKTSSMAKSTYQNIAICYSVIASCYREQGDLNKAKKSCEMALKIGQEYFSVNYPKEKSKLDGIKGKLQNIKLLLQQQDEQHSPQAPTPN